VREISHISAWAKTMTSKGLKCGCTFLARWANLAEMGMVVSPEAIAPLTPEVIGRVLAYRGQLNQ
jgi:hypothetical protein